jgi:hypothetical protein
MIRDICIVCSKGTNEAYSTLGLCAGCMCKAEKTYVKIRAARTRAKNKIRRCMYCGTRTPAEGHTWVDQGNGKLSCGGPDCVAF